jgi:hypothetical protein
MLWSIGLSTTVSRTVRNAPQTAGRFKRRRDCACELGNGCQHLSPVPEQDAYFLQVLIGQIAEHREINSVLGKALRVLPET